ncbi:DNA polymerase/3'-5' exonuclease PolX [Terriglobus albidus]|uniref:DNA polymerase beta n=1 Tax=Terriglobus albidus TaxID=1592106 RepID=A0A5B9EBP9_9BACT|nr:DNA polymerase/3'-5' exonuclease PolX [Terriglobus albidus]QEE27707.1 DNA polymerase/3'-5' exonuclease PolX [Terriglobus albidus]
MENVTIARLLDETADLLEIDAADPFRIRSYRRAAEAVEQQTTQLATLVDEPKQLLAIAGIGKSMASNIVDLVKSGSMPLREELLAKYRSTMLELLKLPGMGPKTVALIWSALGVADIDSLETAAKEGKLNDLPRFGQKQVDKILKGIEDFRKNTGRYRIDDATATAERIAALIREFPGIDTVTPAGSLRRGRETVGDLDLLVTGPACEPDCVAAVVDHVAALPLIANLIAKGQNKVSFNMRNGLQVDVRMLPKSSYGAALQYFTGSKMHNVALRQRAIKMGYTLSEYALARMDDSSIVASATEQEIYNALGLDYIPPELRENNGEIEAAQAHTLPRLIELADIRGDVHSHTIASDGRQTIREMAEGALAKGYKFLAITDHTKNLAMTNGLDDARALEHIAAIREVDRELEGRIRVFAGIEVDILGDGALDLEDSTLAQMDVVIGSVHTLFNQPYEEMTARILRAVENPYLRILGHPTGRKVMAREAYTFDLERVLRRCAELGVMVEHNAGMPRLDLSDRNLRLAKELGCRISVNTDAHAVSDFEQMPFGITQLRRAWLTPADVINTYSPEEFLAALRPRP